MRWGLVGQGSRTHGIEMERGPHKGRLILPRLGNPQANASALPKGQRPPTESYAIFSDVRRTLPLVTGLSLPARQRGRVS